MAAVCAAPTVLSELGILKDKKATSYPSFEGKLDCAEYLQQPYVVDGNVITSRGMGTCIEFAGAIIAALKDDETAKQVKDAIVYQGIRSENKIISEIVIAILKVQSAGFALFME